MRKFHYYKCDGADWTDRELLLVVEADSITEADKEFEAQTGVSPGKGTSISVTLAPLNNLPNTKGSEDGSES